MPSSKQYILGTGSDELSRLGIQHRIWADAAVSAWKRAGMGPGSHVLDLGSGPGYAAFDLAQLITTEGKLIAIDESQEFVDYLNHQAQVRGLNHLNARKGDALSLKSSLKKGERFDGVYCRWVLCWLKNPEKVLKGIHNALKPGAKLVIHDYFNWTSMTLAPRSDSVTEMVEAAHRSFLDRDGDVDLSARLLKMLREAKFEVLHLGVDQRIARGGGLDSTLAWPLTWWRSYGPKLVQSGHLSKKSLKMALDDLNELEKNPDYFFYCPPVFEFICRRT